MEDLNKNQIVLLTLLVSFVTSIATGIMTTSLLQQAPVEVTRNINRIVEKTIETVTPSTITSPTQKEVTTVVVKEEDMIIGSINKNANSIVRIKEKDTYLGTNSFYGIGLIIGKDGSIVADRKNVITSNIYTGIMPDGTEFNLTPIVPEKPTNFMIFKANISDKSDKKQSYVFNPVVFGDADPKLGQTVIGLGGSDNNAVTVGRVTSLEMKDITMGTSTSKYLSSINTDLSTRDLVEGSALFNLSGDIVGVKISSDAVRTFYPAQLLKKEISSLTEPKKAE